MCACPGRMFLSVKQIERILVSHAAATGLAGSQGAAHRHVVYETPSHLARPLHLTDCLRIWDISKPACLPLLYNRGVQRSKCYPETLAGDYSLSRA